MAALYTLQEVSKNTGKDGSRLWVIIRDIVYDLTEYVEEHPGGSELLSNLGGKDGTKDFDDFGHSGDAKNMMKPYKIGELVEADKRQNREKKTAWPEKSEQTEKTETSERSCLGKILRIFCA